MLVLRNDHCRKLIQSQFHFFMLGLSEVTSSTLVPILISLAKKQSWKPGGLGWGTEERRTGKPGC